MIYEIQTTDIYDKWFASVKSIEYRARIIKRIRKVSLGHFGDVKPVGGSLFEMRFFFGAGYRIYYTIKGNKVVLLLCGGDKSSQSKDIDKAKSLFNELEK